MYIGTARQTYIATTRLGGRESKEGSRLVEKKTFYNKLHGVGTTTHNIPNQDIPTIRQNQFWANSVKMLTYENISFSFYVLSSLLQRL